MALWLSDLSETSSLIVSAGLSGCEGSGAGRGFQSTSGSKTRDVVFRRNRRQPILLPDVAGAHTPATSGHSATSSHVGNNKHKWVFPSGFNSKQSYDQYKLAVVRQQTIGMLRFWRRCVSPCSFLCCNFCFYVLLAESDYFSSLSKIN